MELLVASSWGILEIVLAWFLALLACPFAVPLWGQWRRQAPAAPASAGQASVEAASEAAPASAEPVPAAPAGTAPQGTAPQGTAAEALAPRQRASNQRQELQATCARRPHHLESSCPWECWGE